MKNKIKKWHIILMSFIALFIAVFASLFSLKADTVDDETGEVIKDNWEIGVVFYDSSVNNGNTPLQSINWNATDYDEKRTIIVQINYRNDSCSKTYNPNELSIIIPNLTPLIDSPDDGLGLEQRADIGAGTSEDGFIWNYTKEENNIILRNNEILPENTPFTGSIQIGYTYQASTIHHGSQIPLTAILYCNEEQITNSNTINFNFISNKANYAITKKASSLKGMDGLPSNAENYIWVRWDIKQDLADKGVRRLKYSGLYIEEIIPTDAIILNQDLTPLENNNGKATINMDNYDWGSYDGNYYCYIGYPKEKYDGQIIENTVKSYGIYWAETEASFLTEYTTQIDLTNYGFAYTGQLYSPDKEGSKKSGKPYFSEYKAKNNIEQSLLWGIGGDAIYTGSPMDIVIGDDILFAPNSKGIYEQLTDNEYYFSTINYHGTWATNINNSPIKNYDMYLYIRYANTSEYVQYGDVYKANEDYVITMPNNSVGWKIIIKDVDESFISRKITNQNYYKQKLVDSYTKIKKSDIGSSGNIYNFSYLQVYIDGELQNEPDINSYTTPSTITDIAAYDKETYGTYMQRDYGSIEILTNKMYGYLIKSANTPSHYPAKEGFEIKYSISSDLDPQYGTSNNFKGFTYYDLLPEGMELIETEEEIIANIANQNIFSPQTWKTISGKNFSTSEELLVFWQEHCFVTITKNWKNTERTRLKIEFNFTEDPVNFTDLQTSYRIKLPSIYYNAYLSYDNYLEYGKSYNNTAYMDFIDSQNSDCQITSSGLANSKITRDYDDINENGIAFDEGIFYSSVSRTINTVISTHQDVQTQVQSSYDSFTTNTAKSDYNDKYQYKLRVRTGTTSITNLVTYTNLESYIRKYKTDENGYCLTDEHGNYIFDVLPISQKEKWQGEFLSIDTSYAENKGYTIKTYYSTKDNAGTLTEDDSWKEYIAPEYTNGLAITFNENCSTSSDYFYIYFTYNVTGELQYIGKYSAKNMAGKTIKIPSNDFYLYWVSDSTENNDYGFSIDKIEPINYTGYIGSTAYNLPSGTIYELNGNNYPETEHNPYKHNETVIWHYTVTPNAINEYTDPLLVKSLAFEYLDDEGNPAIIPANNLTYVLVNMKAPENKDITTCAYNGCWTQWTALNEFNQPVDFITGINSNIVKVILPNSIDDAELYTISLRFTKEINGTGSQFENMKLNKTDTQTFMIRLTNLTANDDGSYNQVTALLKSNQELVITQIPIGTYLLEELDDNYFNFINFEENNSKIVEGVALERTDQGYIITVSEDLTENIEFNIKVTNEIEDERFYEYKDNKENLFLKNKVEES